MAAIRWTGNDNLDYEDIQKTHPGFEVQCRACRSFRVITWSDVGFSALSGAWGEVSLTCLDCRYTEEIWKPE